MMDAEMAFCEHEENMKIQENLISHIVKKVLEKNEYELSLLERPLDPLKKIIPPFYRFKHKEVVDMLRKEGSDLDYHHDLGGDDETVFSAKYDKPIFVEQYPAQVKAFYMKRVPGAPNYVLNNDLLAPEGYGEIIGGSQREDNYEELMKRVYEHKLNPEDFQWYLDLRKFGSIPHSGFGYGLERLVAWICGLKHVRETIPFPRMIYRKSP
jgi:asparaginyl-tRNA synthetase